MIQMIFIPCKQLLIFCLQIVFPKLSENAFCRGFLIYVRKKSILTVFS